MSYNPQVERSLQDIRVLLYADHSALLQIKQNIIEIIDAGSSTRHLRAS